MDYLVFFANDVEKISILGKKKAQVLTIYNTNGKKRGSYCTNSGEKSTFGNLQDKYPQGPYRYLHTFP